MIDAELIKLHDYGADIVVGARVELSPHLDLWMRGARFGIVAKIQGTIATVKLDARPRKNAQVHDLIRR